MRILTWIIRILLATAFVMAGGSKLSGVPAMVAEFDKIGLGQWFRYLTGLTEISGAILLLIPATGLWGALVLVATMCGAVATHLLRIGGNPAAAIVLGVLAAFVAYRLRPAGVLASQPHTESQ
jgi:putative oxidoreductase